MSNNFNRFFNLVILSLILIIGFLCDAFSQRVDSTMIKLNNNEGQNYVNIKSVNISYFSYPTHDCENEKKIEIYFKINDSIVKFIKGDSIFFEKSKNYKLTMLLFYCGGMSSFDIDYRHWCYYDKEGVSIYYYPISEISKLSKSNMKKAEIKYYRKNNLYGYDFDRPFILPDFYLHGKKLKIEDVYYGIYVVNIGLCYYTVFDRKNYW